MMRILISASLVLLMHLSVQATEEKYQFDTPEQQALFQELVAELRCPKCQNQNIADSNAVVAKDLRNKVQKLIKEGQDKQQIIDYMIARYGEFVYYQPPFNASTAVLWIGPVAFLLFGIWFVIRRTQQASPAAKPKRNNADKVAALLKEEKDS